MERIRTWLITGADKGRGFELVRQALLQGDNVIAVALNLRPLRVAFNVPPSRFLPVVMDVADEKNVRGVVRMATRRFGSIDILVNCGDDHHAQDPHPSKAQVEERTEITYRYLNVIRSVLPGMRRARCGHIVNFAAGSRHDSANDPGKATRQSIDAMTEALSFELGPDNIRLTTVVQALVLDRFEVGESCGTGDGKSRTPIEEEKLLRQAMASISSVSASQREHAATMQLISGRGRFPLRILINDCLVASALAGMEVLCERISTQAEEFPATGHLQQTMN